MWTIAFVLNYWMNSMTTDILYKEECYQIQGAIYEVFREMGCGFLEAVYQEFLNKKLPFVAQQQLN